MNIIEKITTLPSGKVFGISEVMGVIVYIIKVYIKGDFKKEYLLSCKVFDIT